MYALVFLVLFVMRGISILRSCRSVFGEVVKPHMLCLRSIHSSQAPRMGISEFKEQNLAADSPEAAGADIITGRAWHASELRRKVRIVWFSLCNE